MNIKLLILLNLATAFGKIYEPCELATELINVHNVSRSQVATWVCIAKHESLLNTAAVGRLNGDNSADHGLFQISDLYWCSPPGKGYACDAECSEFEDDDISDDVECIQKIYQEHQELYGNGFHAWTVYPVYCNENVDSYIQGCFNVSTPSRQQPPSTKKSRKISKPRFSNIFLDGSITIKPFMKIVTPNSLKNNIFFNGSFNLGVPATVMPKIALAHNIFFDGSLNLEKPPVATSRSYNFDKNGLEDFQPAVYELKMTPSTERDYNTQYVTKFPFKTTFTSPVYLTITRQRFTSTPPTNLAVSTNH